MNKTYDYDEVMQYCQTELSSSVEKLCNDLQQLKTMVEEAEEHFHGKGDASSIRKNYEAIYNNIGQVTSDDGLTSVKGKGMWGAAAVTKNLVNAMYTNAKTDSEVDSFRS